jgi:hypothetical protein
LQTLLISEFHDSKYAGHFRMSRTRVAVGRIYIPREPTYSLGSWGAQEHLYCSDNLLSMQKRSKLCLPFSLPFSIIRHNFRRIHDVRLRFPRIMLDTIILSGNLVIGFRVLNAPKSMLKTRFHLILESAFHFNWRRWGLHPAAFPIRLK